MVKNLVSVRILAPLVQVWAPKFFPWILLLLDVRHYCKLSMHATKRKTYESNLRNWQKKKLDSGVFLAHLTQIWDVKFFFLQNLTQSVTRYHGQLTSFTISEKTTYPIMRKLSDELNFKIYDLITRLTNNYNTHIAKYLTK